MKESLSTKQTAFFCSIMFFSSKLLILPTLLFKANGYGAILCLAFILLLEFLMLFLFIKLKEKYPNNSFKEILSMFFSNFFIKILFIILFLFFIIKIAYVLQENFHFLKLGLYEKATIFVFLICVIPVINALVFKGLRAFGRSLEVFYYLIILGIVICSLIWVASISNYGFNIYENNGWGGFFEGSFLYSFWFCDFIFLFMIIDKIKIEDNYGRILMRYSIFSGIIYLIFCSSFYFIYQSVSFFQTSAIFDLIQFASRIGYVGKLDILAIFPIMFLIFYQGGMFLYCAKECYKEILNTKNEVQSLIFINIFVLLIYYFFIQNSDNLLNYSTSILVYLGVFVGYLLPLILFFFYISNKNKQEHTYRKKILKNYKKQKT